MPDHLQDILLIANPASQNGKGAHLAEEAVEELYTRMNDSTLDVLLTKDAHHATEIAAGAAGYSSVIILGGDGVIHEAVNGIMSIPKEERPCVGVIPTGSGNDFAKALGMPSGVHRACKALCSSIPKATDIGSVNGSWFTETLSFGLDAAIALDTVERRKTSGRKGTALYAESAYHQLKDSFRSYEYELVIDGRHPVCGESITFAVQNGPYYGGGFCICPEAKLDDGLLDICISHPPVTRAKAVIGFLKAKTGHHVGMHEMELFKAEHLVIDFKEMPPTQVDGEAVHSTHYEVGIEHDAVRFLYPQSR
ncbi:MAG: diacylglycerol kinase family lipid kinase [Eggerthellaceae bacterium]|nr:diacylglycerol kinase family lipid kinase [Eggerthellaceae bacterium]